MHICYFLVIILFNKKRWDELYIVTNKDFPDTQQMMCAGFLEGIASKDAIDAFKHNT